MKTSGLEIGLSLYRNQDKEIVITEFSFSKFILKRVRRRPKHNIMLFRVLHKFQA